MIRMLFSIVLIASAPFAAFAQDTTAFTNVSVITMEDERVLEAQTVIVIGDRIVEIGATEEVDVPSAATTIDGEGRYLMPGLAEMHAHVPGADGAYAQEDVVFLYVARGVTTARGMQGRAGQLALREQARDPEFLSPTLYLAAPSLSGNSVDGPDHARALVNQYADEGWDLLKAHEGLTIEEYDAIAATANARSIPFGGHVSDAVGLEHAFESRQRTIDHMDNYLGLIGAEATPVTPDMLERAVKTTPSEGVGVVPTAALWETFATDPKTLGDFPEVRYAPKSVVAQWASSQKNIYSNIPSPEIAALMIENRRKLLKALSDGGVELLLGSDAPQIFSVPGFSINREMAVMAEAG